ncbi:MAG: GMC oxidoreductase [Cyclobacteriaceae bacterium]|uniref:GMC oxidoreductase n=1 Tax=Fulvivirga sp. TaxID=1931237 RepID=UPI0032EC42F7
MDTNYDLIVVGTGFASSFFLKNYLEIQGTNTRVLVLERGKFHPHSKRLSEKRGEVNLAINKAGKTYRTNSDKIWVFDPNFGGSSNCWTGCTPRFLPNDLKLRSTYGVGRDWPISYDDLSPYYDRVEQIMQIAGPELTPFPKSSKYPLPPHKLSTVDQILQKKYGSQYISQPTARASLAVGDRNACCTSAVCDVCPVNSKFTIENGIGDIYKDVRVTLKYNCQVLGLKTGSNTAQSIEYLEEGISKSAKADTYVLGANGVFNAHILLNSGDDNPLTGAGITEQVGVFARLYYKDLDNVGGSSIITANGYMMYDGAHRKDHAGCLIESFNTPFIRNEAGKWRKMSIFKFVYEDLPDNGNKVKLTEDERIPEIVYNGHSTYTQRAIDKLPEQIKEYFSILPIERMEVDNYRQKTEFHICSSTRMGDTIDNSVVDKNLVHHKYKNILVLGSSVYPTVTPANPTLTLSALSLMACNNYFQ